MITPDRACPPPTSPTACHPTNTPHDTTLPTPWGKPTGGNAAKAILHVKKRFSALSAAWGTASFGPWRGTLRSDQR
jgi:hypothetical protein